MGQALSRTSSRCHFPQEAFPDSRSQGKRPRRKQSGPRQEGKDKEARFLPATSPLSLHTGQTPLPLPTS